ncbi:Branched-chain amino acid ABC transporter, amino acid-binding protein (TC 3.A.1.4.1) [Alloactinosynnema sp. L-07]|uniref:branched-chain amino acid ABC transporter substrate-binding protein n=1 Tax=Alloactinosynnema sp. L-07 TaxID=1653480 RepID=UPI00065EFDDB|nr:branched-chain amino acid ABC transporter substrate-binding protein [Alloactinosynnema sp. L-07]CRK56125.1 Branched-chain amino acid ABC transporter, amino acid-binding protein (TC 3.A.1.4.1) [Alloactinosynnema sp. L-07]
MRNQTVKAGVLVAGALLLAACGTNKTETGAGGGNQSCDQSKGTLVIGVIAPQSGGLSALGLGIKNSAQLAADQANEKCAVKGYKLAVQTEDDQATAQVGAQAATRLSSNANVVGVVGTLNSSVAQSVQPILKGKNIVQISPANTNPALTRGADYGTAPKRAFETYFRVCATDDLQGPFAAKYLVGKAGKKSIAIITDGKTYGEGLAAEFKKQAEKDGAKIVASAKVGEKDTDFAGVIATIKGSNPDAIYYGGEYPQAGPLSKQAKDAGLNVPVMGGDGIYDQKYIDLGGKEGDLATSVGAPTDTLPSAKAFIDAYKAKGFKDDFSAYGAFSYDATNAIIGSLAKAVEGGDWSDSKRADVIKNVQSYSAQGATGDIKFDEYGDSTNKLLTVYKVSAGKWVADETGTFGG